MKHQAISLQLARFDPEADLALVEKWLRLPHVTRWWGNPEQTLAEIRDHDTQTAALILVARRPIGYLCWQSPTSKELRAAGLTGLPADLVDIDIMIGETRERGLGYGPAALTRLFDQLYRVGVKWVGVATAESNQRARKAFVKAGFKLYQPFIESGEQMLYLIRELTGFGVEPKDK